MWISIVIFLNLIATVEKEETEVMIVHNVVSAMPIHVA